MRRRPSVVTVVLAVATAAALITAFLVVGRSSSASTARERMVTATRGVVQKTVSGSGTLEPSNQVDLSFGASGTVTHVYVTVGDRVVQGQALARIDPSNAEASLAQAEAQLQSAEDSLTQTENAATAAAAPTTSKAGTTTSGGGSGSTVSVASAQASVTSAQLSVTSAEKAVAATKIVAPHSGTVSAVNGAVGENVSAGSSGSGGSGGSNGGSASNGSSATVAGGLGGGGDTSSSSSSSSSSGSGFITLVQLHRYEMDVSLSESDIASVRKGQSAAVTVNAVSNEQFAAHVSAIGVMPSSSGSSSAVSYPVTLALDQRSARLKPGMSATADIVTAQARGVTIPTQALTGSTVTVQGSNGKQQERTVQVGLTGNSSVQIVSGLHAGDQVVVRATTVSPSSSSGGTSSAGGLRLGGAGFAPGGFGGGPPRLGGGGIGGGGVR
ncbi:MAG TPA: biotin/lipoyl-binding protein [Solirubrobacteraceae bacterium]|nr:biotin/lipoyl-binding protein [Solirubrobacteraceae bacterium]